MMFFDSVKIAKEPKLSCMTVRQLAILESLALESKNNTSIGLHLGLHKSIVSKAMQRLFDLKLIEYFMPESKDIRDQRKRYIRLSDKARSFFANGNV